MTKKENSLWRRSKYIANKRSVSCVGTEPNPDAHVSLKSKMNDYIKYEENRQNANTKAKNYTVPI